MKKKHILFEPTEKELEKLILWASNEIAEYQSFRSECQKRLKTMGKKTGKKTKF